MGVDLKQNADGTLSLRNENTGADVLRIGGPATIAPAVAAGSQGTIAYRGASYVKATIGGGAGLGGGTAGGGAILNPFPNDVVVGAVLVNVTAVNTANTVGLSIGTGASSTTYSANLLDSAQIVATGVFDNNTDKGTLGKSRGLWTNAQFITITTQTTLVTFAATVLIEVINP